MIDSVCSVVVGGEAAAGLSVLPVVPDAGCEREDSLADTYPDAVEGAAAVAFERELVFGGVVDRFDPLPDTAEVAVAGLLVLAVGAQQLGCELLDDLFELLAGEAFVADDDLVAAQLAVAAHPVEQGCGDLAFALVGGGEAETVRHPVGGTDKVEAEAPEVAGVAGAVAVGAVAGQVGALDRLPRLGARHRGGVEQPQLVAERRRAAREHVDDKADLWCERANPLVVAGLLGEIGEQVAEPPMRQTQEATLLRAVEEHLGDSERDQFRGADPRLLSRAGTLRQEIVDEDIKPDEQGVEVGRHAASLVVVALATSDFDTQPEDHSPAAVNLESII